MRKATVKMIDYAEGISKALLIPLQNFDFDYVSNFISQHKDMYQIKSRQYDYDAVLASVNRLSDFKFEKKCIDYLQQYIGKSGVYVLWSNENLIYIGKSQNLFFRVFSSIKERNNATYPITSVSLIPTPTVADMHILEPLLIIENKPFFNQEFNCLENSTMFKSNINIHLLDKIKVSDWS